MHIDAIDSDYTTTFLVGKSQFIDVSWFNPQFLSDRIYLMVKYHCLLVVTTHLIYPIWSHIDVYPSTFPLLISESLSDNCNLEILKMCKVVEQVPISGD